jgi:hypothetical protein
VGVWVLSPNQPEGAVAIVSPETRAAHEVTVQPETRDDPQVDPAPTFQTYELGQQFSVGYWTYLCQRAFRTPFIGSDAFTFERANAQFVVIQITARNDDTSASTIPPFKLMDAEGRTYDESSAGMLNGGFFSVLEELNPGVSKTAFVAFDVPMNRTYELAVSGGIVSGTKAIVALRLDAPPVN